MNRKHRLERRSIVVAVLGILVGVGAAGAVMVGRAGAQAPRAEGRVTGRAVLPRGPLLDDEQRLVELFERVSPSVVYVSTRSLQQYSNMFGRRYTQEVSGEGSGFVWDEQGHIVTNFHVIGSRQNRTFSLATEVNVVLADGTTRSASIIGIAPEDDLAVLRMTDPPSGLRPIDIGTSSDLRVGQSVLAIGNPYGLDQSLTRGIVSALGRSITSLAEIEIESVIQTDAAINPGNSGGPLLDSAGRLIGVNTAIRSPSGGSAGVGFAVPVDTVNQTVPEIIQHGRKMRPVLGIEHVDARFAAQLGVRRGVLIGSVRQGGAAFRAGLAGSYQNRRGEIILGDIIVAVGEREVHNWSDLVRAIDRYREGDRVMFRVIRNGEERRVEVELDPPMGAG